MGLLDRRLRRRFPPDLCLRLGYCLQWCSVAFRIFAKRLAPGTLPRCGTAIQSVVLSLAIVSLIGCGGAEDRKAKHFERAKSLYEQGNYVKARLEFKNVLQIDPKHVESLYMLGQVAESEQDFAAAYRNYNRAVKLDPEHVGARVHVGGIYLLSGQFDKAMEMAELSRSIDF